MKKLLAIFTLICLIPTITMAADICKPASDAIYAQTLLGKTWQDKEMLTLDGQNFATISHFKKDNQFSGILVNKENPKKIILKVAGTWEIKDGKRIEFIKSAKSIPSGNFIIDKFTRQITSVMLRDQSTDTIRCASAKEFKFIEDASGRNATETVIKG